MAYTLKTTGIATNLVVCVGVDDDGTIKDFKANAITLGTGVAASVATGSWKGTSRQYFVTTANGGTDFNGVRWSSPPVVDNTDADGMSIFIALHGASARSGNGPFVTYGTAGTSFNGLITDPNKLGLYLGAFKALTTTTVPSDGTTKWSFGTNYKSNSDSEAFYGLESGSLSSEATAGSDGGFGSSTHALYNIGGSTGQGNQPASFYLVAVFNKKLSLAEMQSLHDDWFGTLFDGGGGTTSLPPPRAFPYPILNF